MGTILEMPIETREEIIAMNNCWYLLRGLEREEFERVMTWLRDRYEEHAETPDAD